MRLCGIITLALAVSALTACSGGGGGGGNSAPPAQPPATPTTVSGTAAVNTALAGVGVEALGPNPLGGNSAFVFTTQSAQDGSYSVTSSATVRPPFLIHTPAGIVQFEDSDARYPTLHSLAIRGGTANVTPLTQLAIARLLNRRLSYSSDVTALFEMLNVTETQLGAARQRVVDYLMTRPSKDNGNANAPVDVNAVSDFFSIPVTTAPGDPYFDALRRLHNSLMESESLQGVEEHMLFGNDAPLDIGTMLSLNFPARCFLKGPDNGSMPQGDLSIALSPGGIAFGTLLQLPFLPGDQLKITADQTSTQTWLFTFPSRGWTVEFHEFQDQLSSVRVSILGTSSECGPMRNLLVSDQTPSITALVRLFAQAINNPNSATPALFQCSSPALFFQDGANQLITENNGALRINTPTGPALHLPSLNLNIETNLVVTAGQVSLIQPSRFQASRTFKGGQDDLILALTNVGQITGLKLTRQRNGQPSQSQTCGVI
jgi:hypothetical protein